MRRRSPYSSSTSISRVSAAPTGVRREQRARGSGRRAVMFAVGLSAHCRRDQPARAVADAGSGLLRWRLLGRRRLAARRRDGRGRRRMGAGRFQRLWRAWAARTQRDPGRRRAAWRSACSVLARPSARPRGSAPPPGPSTGTAGRRPPCRPTRSWRRLRPPWPWLRPTAAAAWRQRRPLAPASTNSGHTVCFMCPPWQAADRGCAVRALRRDLAGAHVLVPQRVVFLRPAFVDIAGAHRAVGALHAERADVDVAA